MKMEVMDWSPAAQAVVGEKAGGRKVFMVVATLRPETMYGKTNRFFGTGIKYRIFAANDKEAYLCTLRGARNMAFQCTITIRGHVEQLAEVDSAKLIGTETRPPYALTPEVYVLPLDNMFPMKVRHFFFFNGHYLSAILGYRCWRLRSVRFSL